MTSYAPLRLAAAGCGARPTTCCGSGGRCSAAASCDGVRILGRPIVDLMTREVTVNGLGTMADRLIDDHYGIGWGRPGAASPGSPLAFGHGGVTGTRLWIDPAYDLVYVYLTGLWGAPIETIDEVELASTGRWSRSPPPRPARPRSR